MLRAPVSAVFKIGETQRSDSTFIRLTPNPLILIPSRSFRFLPNLVMMIHFWNGAMLPFSQFRQIH
jgi:hypothetical protein